MAAEELFVQAMEILKKKLDENHPDALGMINEASLHMRALDIGTFETCLKMSAERPTRARVRED